MPKDRAPHIRVLISKTVGIVPQSNLIKEGAYQASLTILGFFVSHSQKLVTLKSQDYLVKSTVWKSLWQDLRDSATLAR